MLVSVSIASLFGFGTDRQTHKVLAVESPSSEEEPTVLFLSLFLSLSLPQPLTLLSLSHSHSLTCLLSQSVTTACPPKPYEGGNEGDESQTDARDCVSVCHLPSTTKYS